MTRRPLVAPLVAPAFSDSWGPDFAERWLPAAAVQAVSSGEVWVLNF